MANAFEAYQRAKAGAMQQGQNAFAMEQAVQKAQRDRELRGILQGAYTPELAAAKAQGPMQPGAAPLPDYTAQAGGMNMQNAIGAMYKGGFGPEAMAMEAKQRGLSGATPSAVNEYKFFKNLTKDDQEQFLAVKRAQKYLDIGSGYVAPSQVTPSAAPRDVVTRELKPTETPEYIAKKEETKATSKALTEEKLALENMEAGLPALKEITAKLSGLGKIATFTKAGQARDAAARQFGGSTKGSVARADYIATVANEILPLLRETFGAAFTAIEGESLKATLGDPNSSPEEKDAQLNAFIESKIRQISTKRRRVGAPEASQAAPKQGAIQGGYVFIGGDPADSKNWKKQ